MSLLPIDKIARAIKIVSKNGGPFKAIYKLWRNDTLKEGTLVGSDCFGNTYYENNNYMIGRSRWVEYNISTGWDYDASQVSPEWYGWLHYKTDKLPNEDCAKYCLYCCCWCHCWLKAPEENMSGTDMAFYPYSTTREHKVVWDGLSICKRPWY